VGEPAAERSALDGYPVFVGACEKGAQSVDSLRRSVALSILVAGAGLVLSRPPVWGTEANSLRVGAAKVDITPKDLTGLVSVWAKAFEGVHDPIYARVLVVDSGAATAAVVALDLVEYGSSRPVRERIARELGSPWTTSSSRRATTTTPPGAGRSPPALRRAGPALFDAAYTQQVDDSILDALRQAKASLQPARVGIGTGRADINVYRLAYKPDGSWAAPTRMALRRRPCGSSSSRASRETDRLVDQLCHPLRRGGGPTTPWSRAIWRVPWSGSSSGSSRTRSWRFGPWAPPGIRIQSTT